MKKITKEYTLYNFDELEQKAKDKAKDNYFSDYDFPYLEEEMTEHCIDLLAKNKIKGEPKVSYSLSYSQGDGAMFYGDFEWDKYTIYIRQSGHYSHSNSKTIEIHETDNLGFDIGDDYNPKVYEKFEKIYQSICGDMEKFGYKCLEDEQSEESFKDTCEANEYTFLSDGTMMNE